MWGQKSQHLLGVFSDKRGRKTVQGAASECLMDRQEDGEMDGEGGQGLSTEHSIDPNLKGKRGLFPLSPEAQEKRHDTAATADGPHITRVHGELASAGLSERPGAILNGLLHCLITTSTSAHPETILTLTF